MTTREQTLDALQLLIASPNHTASNPTAVLISKLAPHLDAHEVAGMLTDARLRTTEPLLFIGPPLLIRGAEHIYSLRRWNGSQELQWVTAYRRKESFYNTQVPPGWRQIDYEHRERVANYAEVNYGHALQWDESRECVTWRVHSETQSFEIVAGYRRTWAEMQQLAEGRCPFLQVLDTQLCAATTSTAIAAEIYGGRTTMLARTCGNCGGGVVGKTCTHCYHEYFVSLPEWDTPIHMHLLESAGQVNKFNISPIHAIKVHYARWAADGIRPITRQIQHDRVITFPDDE